MDEDFYYNVNNSLAVSEARFCILDIIEEFRQLSQHLGCNIFNSNSKNKILIDYIGKYSFIFIDCFN